MCAYLIKISEIRHLHVQTYNFRTQKTKHNCLNVSNILGKSHLSLKLQLTNDRWQQLANVASTKHFRVEVPTKKK